MKISKLKIRNLFGIKEFEADGSDKELAGKNGVNKSAVLDAVKLCLTNKSPREYTILNGEQEGEVFIQTDTGLSVHRKIRTNKADYKSIKVEGDKVEKTEAFLRELFTEIQLNPVEFSKMDPKEQNRIILDLIDFKWDLNWIKMQFGEIPQAVNYEQNILCVLYDIQAENGPYFPTRQEINTEARNKHAFIEEIGKVLPQNYNAEQWKGVNLGDLYKEIEKIRNHNNNIEKSRTVVAKKEGRLRGFQADLEISKAAIDKETTATRTSLEKQISEMENTIKSYRKDLDGLEEKRQDRLTIAQKEYDAQCGQVEGETKQHEDIAAQKCPGFFHPAGRS